MGNFDNFINGIDDALNISITENGAVGFAKTKHAIVDFNFKISSYRDCNEETIQHDFIKVWNEDKELALKFLFFIRDVRGGLGERDLFRIAISAIQNELDARVFDWILEYGRADDLFVFKGTKLEQALIEFIAKTLAKDMSNSAKGESITLLAKWLPSINTSSTETKNLAKWLVTQLKTSRANYRKMLSKLRKYLDVVEVKCCANKWDAIDYEHVPSKANIRYLDAFLKHDSVRRQAYLEALATGETKINSAAAFPHDIVAKYSNSRHAWEAFKPNQALESMWKALPDYVNGDNKTLVVRDGSGSMETPVGKSNVKASHIATALSIYFAERCEGAFKDKFITFSSNPQFVDLTGYNTLCDKLIECDKYSDCSNTNIEKTFMLILSIAIREKLKQSEIPNLLIISDMEFDSATTTYGISTKIRLFEDLEAKFNEAGYKLPRLVFWNVCSRTQTIPLTENENGVILVSGFSPAALNMVLTDCLDPYEALVNVLRSERYSQITLEPNLT